MCILNSVKSLKLYFNGFWVIIALSSINSIFIFVLCFSHPLKGFSLYSDSSFSWISFSLSIENTINSILWLISLIFSSFWVIFSLPLIHGVVFLFLLFTLFAPTFCLHDVVNYQCVFVITWGYSFSKNDIPKSISLFMNS